MPKYQLIDDDDNSVGFVVVNASQFKEVQSVTSSHGGALSASGPVAEGVLFVIVLSGFTAVPLIFGVDGWAAALLGVGLTFPLAAVRVWRGTSLLPVDDEPEAEVLVRGEFKSDEGTVYFDEIADKSIKFESLQRVCTALVNNNFQWMGRPTMMIRAKISRGQYDKIRRQFSILDYFRDGEGNQVLLTMRGRLFVRKVFEYNSRR